MQQVSEHSKILFWDVPSLRQLVDTVPPQRPGFHPVVGCGWKKKAQIFLQGLLFSPVIIMPSIPHTLSCLPLMVYNHIK